jgi:ketosteroid isomerase-like protein
MKQGYIFFLAITFTGLLNIGCGNNNSASTDTPKDSTSTFDLTAMKKIIEEKNNQFTKAHVTGDTAFLNNIFTHDAKVFAPNSDVVMGRHAIAALNSQWVNFDIKEFREETTAFYGGEDYLIDEGNYYARYGKDNTVDKGKYLNVWKKENGDWKMFTNMWNTNMPATPTK